MITDTIADYLTRIRNAVKARHKTVTIPTSKIKVDISSVLQDKGFIESYKVVPAEGDDSPKKNLEITLKYTKMEGSKKEPAIVKIVRVSKPGLRKYYKATEIPPVINGLGIAVLSTSKGVISDKEARRLNVGGELLCYLY